MPDYEWSDETLQSKTTRESQWYQCQTAHRDVIRIIGKISEVKKHSFTDEQGRFNTRMCSMEEHGKCPWCSHLAKQPGHKHDTTWACAVLHMTREAIGSGTKPRFIGKLLAWRFGDDKKASLLEKHHLTGGKIQSHDLSLRLKSDAADDKKFQKIIIDLLPKSVFGSFSAETKKQLQALVKAKAAEVRQLYYPKPEDLESALNGESEATAFEPDELENDSDLLEGDEKPAKTKKKGKKAKKEEIEEEEEDEEESDDDEEDPLAELMG